MDNGYQKLIAKIQHFYDLLKNEAGQIGIQAIDEKDIEVRRECAYRAAYYVDIADKYNEVFKEFLYTEEA